MKNLIIAAAFAAAFTLAPQAKAQCPAGLVDPLYLLDGSNWAFQTEDDFFGEGAVGTFRASVKAPAGNNPFFSGVLAITETINAEGRITRQLQASGKYIINSDCSGGELLFNAGGHAYQFEFVFAKGRTKMFLVTDNTSPRAVGLSQFVGDHGTAVLTPLGCPAGVVDPLTRLAGAWSFHAEDIVTGSVGIFNASIVNGLGFLNVTETTTVLGEVIRGQVFTGKFQVYPDCSGGELLFNTGRNSLQYEFVFADGGNEIFMVSDTAIPFRFGQPLRVGGLAGNRGAAERF